MTTSGHSGLTESHKPTGDSIGMQDRIMNRNIG